MHRITALIAAIVAPLASTTIVVAEVAAQDTAPTERPHPCQGMPEFSQFDFWLGTWDVRLSDGKRVGTNRITKEQGGCVLVENWTSGRGGTGISLNYYDPDAQQWVQNWVDAGGSLITIRGGLQDDGSMLLEGFIQSVGQAGKHAFRGRWTVLDDQRVEQFFEESQDDGATWSEWFRGFYSRRPDDEANAQ